MARADEVADLLKNGKNLGQIAYALRIADSSAEGYAWRAAHEGIVSYFHVIAALSPDERERQLQSKRSRLLGELYSQLWEIETRLHVFVRSTLEREFGEGERCWWAKGIPTEIRQRCHHRREEDPDRLEEYSYTDLLDLWKVLDKQWRLFHLAFDQRQVEKRVLGDKLWRMNLIRNWVMHPAKGRVPTLDDYFFIRDVHALIQSIAEDDRLD